MPIIVYSALDVAGVSIADQLKSMFTFKRVDNSEISLWENSITKLVEINVPPPNAENLDFDTDYYIFASKHKSASGKPAFTVHPVGNWESADLGGKPRTIGITYPSKMKIALCEMKRLAEKKFEWDVTMEATHHGPNLSKPLLFVELGSTENEWKNEEAAAIVADSIMAAVKNETKYKCAFAVGGSHYAPSFNRVMLNGEYAIGHILPKYHIDKCDLELFRQGIEKSCEKVSTVLLDWKGMDKGQREKVMGFVKDLGIDYEKL